jgi:formylglycine-generating enzyme required for sulfatase activity
MPAVSVLHSPRDEALGEKIATALSRGGHETRCLKGDPLSGDLLLEDGAAIVIWSNATAKLARLHTQAREALERGALIPVTVGGASAPSGFEALQPVDLSGWGGDDNDPRWRFVLEEINLAMERTLIHDGAVWTEAENAPSCEQPNEEPPSEDDMVEAPAEAPIGLAAGPVEDAAPFGRDDLLMDHDAPASDIVSDDVSAPVAGDAEAAPEPINVEASYKVSVDQYWPDPLVASRKSFRFKPMHVVAGGGVGLFALSAAAMLLAPSILSSNRLAAPNNPAAEEIGSIAFVQPLTPIEDNASLPKPQSDFEVTSYRKGAAPIEELPTDDIASAQTGAVDGAAANLPGASIVAEPIVVAMAGAGALADSFPVASVPVANIVAAEPASIDPAIDDSVAAVVEGDAMEILVAEVTGDAAAATLPAPDLTPAAALLPEDVISRIHLGHYFSDCEACPNMAALPAGSFLLGSPPSEPTRRQDEGPITDITLAKPFAIATREVTYTEWDACVADGGCRDYRPSDMGWGRGERPVANISYEDAKSYVAWLSAKTGKAYRLPSEAEWEFAARGGSRAAFAFGNNVSPETANYNGTYPYFGDAGEFRGRTTPVASFAPNNFGLYDMHGNLWEWTDDCWNDTHAGAPADGAPVILSACGSRVLKGGAWNTGGWRLRSAHRINKRAAARENDIGFRVARDLD